MIRERIEGFKFLLSEGSVRYFMVGTILLSSLMALLKKTSFSEYLFYATAFYFAFLLNYYVVSIILGKLKKELELKKIMAVSTVAGLVSLAILPDFYFYIFLIGFSLWVLIESYSFTALAWELSGKTERIRKRFQFSLVIILIYLAYLGFKLYTTLEAPASQTAQDIGAFDMLFGLFMFFYAFSKMGSRFMHTRRVGAELVAVFIMTITLGYVLFVYSPFDTEQFLYYFGKFIGIGITLPVFHAMRKIRKEPLSDEPVNEVKENDKGAD